MTLVKGTAADGTGLAGRMAAQLTAQYGYVFPPGSENNKGIEALAGGVVDAVNADLLGAAQLGPVTATATTQGRRLEDRFADVLNAKDFGCVGDGVADDTAALDAFMAAIQGKVGYIPSGTYRTTHQLVINTDGTRLYGDKLLVNASNAGFQGTTISYHGTDDNVMVVGWGTDATTTHFLESITVENLRIKRELPSTKHGLSVWFLVASRFSNISIMGGNGPSGALTGLRVRATVDVVFENIKVYGDLTAPPGEWLPTGVSLELSVNAIPATSTIFRKTVQEFCQTGFYCDFDCMYHVDHVIWEHCAVGLRHKGYGLIIHPHAESITDIPIVYDGWNAGASFLEGSLAIVGGVFATAGSSSNAFVRCPSAAWAQASGSGIIFRGTAFWSGATARFIDGAFGPTPFTFEGCRFYGPSQHTNLTWTTSTALSVGGNAIRPRIKIADMQERTYRFLCTPIANGASNIFGVPTDGVGAAPVGTYAGLGAKGFVMPDSGHIVGVHCYPTVLRNAGADNITSPLFQTNVFFEGPGLTGDWGAGKISLVNYTEFGNGIYDIMVPPFSPMTGATGGGNARFSRGDLMFCNFQGNAGFARAVATDWVIEITVALGWDGIIIAGESWH